MTRDTPEVGTPLTRAREIPLTKGMVTLVDAADYDFLMQWKWHVNSYTGRGYAIRFDCSNKKKVKIRMHRLIMNPPEGMYVDHIDGNTLNNQRSNLRICTTSQNQMNSAIRSNNTSGYKGVSYVKKENRYRMHIIFQGKRIAKDSFKTAEEAAAAYEVKGRELFGEFFRKE